MEHTIDSIRKTGFFCISREKCSAVRTHFCSVYNMHRKTKEFLPHKHLRTDTLLLPCQNTHLRRLIRSGAYSLSLSGTSRDNGYRRCTRLPLDRTCTNDPERDPRHNHLLFHTFSCHEQELSTQNTSKTYCFLSYSAHAWANILK